MSLVVVNYWMAAGSALMAGAAGNAFSATDWRMGVVYACFCVANAALSTIA
jgi:hypothetical protein